MPDEIDETIDDGEGGENDSDLVKDLRQRINDQKKLIESYHPLAQAEAFRRAKLDPESGQAKMLARIIDAEKKPWTKETVEEMASQYGVALGDEGDGGNSRPGPTGSDPAVEADRQRAAAATNADGLIDQAPPSPGTDTEREQLLTKVDETYEAGDVLANIALQRKYAGYSD